MPVLYFIRHGETDFNVAQRLQGRSETSLNARGRTQAREYAGILRDLFERDRRQPSDYAYVSSPLLRARETMELQRSELGLDPSAYAMDERLAEISYGEWEGRSRKSKRAIQACCNGASATSGIFGRLVESPTAKSPSVSPHGTRR